MTTLTTHVLDAALGVPASGLGVALRDTDATVLEELVTDADGRARFGVDLGPGTHTLTFGTGPWFSAADRDTFFPEVDVTFAVDPAQDHYHVALLLSPYSYTTYRGS